MVASGVLSLVRPGAMGRWLRRKGVRAVRRYLFAAAFLLGTLLVSATWGQEGAVPKIVTGIGLVLILKGVFLAKAKSAEVITDRLASLPPLYLRLFALVKVGVGCLILFGLKE